MEVYRASFVNVRWGEVTRGRESFLHKSRNDDSSICHTRSLRKESTHANYISACARMNVCSGLCLTTRFCRQRTCGVEELGVCKETGYEIFQYAGTSISLELTRGVDNSWCEVTVKGAPQASNPLVFLLLRVCDWTSPYNISQSSDYVSHQWWRGVSECCRGGEAMRPWS